MRRSLRQGGKEGEIEKKRELLGQSVQEDQGEQRAKKMQRRHVQTVEKGDQRPPSEASAARE